MVEVKTDSNSFTIHLEGDKQVWPCRCGETHRGDYGFYDWSHHTCFHRDVMWMDIPNAGQVMCSECGDSWNYERSQRDG